MLMYPSGYRAGNFADIHKHSIFCYLLKNHFLQTPEQAVVMDTHAGPGVYLVAEENKKAGMIQNVFHLLKQDGLSPALEPYLDTISLIQEKNRIKASKEGKEIQAGTSIYPGLPRISLTMMRENDILICSESRSREANLLSRHLGADKRATAFQRNGLDALTSYEPPEKARYMSFVHPIYKNKDDYSSTGNRILNAYKKAPGMTTLVWYPLLKEGYDKILKTSLLKAGIKRTIMSECTFRMSKGFGDLYGSGVIILNAPDTCEDDVTAIGNDLAKVLSPDGKGKAQCYLINA